MAIGPIQCGVSETDRYRHTNIVFAHKSKQIVKIFSEANRKGSGLGTYIYDLWTSLEHQEASSDTYMTKLTQR